MRTYIKSAIFGLMLFSGAVQASIITGNYGETGWQTGTYTFTQDFTGSVLLGVSNYGDKVMDAVALFDHLVGLGPGGNGSFEGGDLAGYGVNGTASAVTASYSYSGTEYLATDGSLFAQLVSNNSSTAWIGGTNGAWLEVPVTATSGDTISFDWAFFATDYAPFADLLSLPCRTAREACSIRSTSQQ